MVQHVEKLRTDLKPGLFGDLRVLDQREVKVELPWTQKNSNSGVAKQRGASGTSGLRRYRHSVRHNRRRGAECVGIEKARATAVSSQARFNSARGGDIA